MSSYFSKLSMKSHKYETAEPFKNMSWKDMINNIDPTDIPSNIVKRDENSFNSLSNPQKNALRQILAWKKFKKNNPSVNLDLVKKRKQFIFEYSGNIDPEAQALIDDEIEKTILPYDKLVQRNDALNDRKITPKSMMSVDYETRHGLLPTAPTTLVKGGKRRRTKRRKQSVRKKKSTSKRRKSKRRKSQRRKSQK